MVGLLCTLVAGRALAAGNRVRLTEVAAGVNGGNSQAQFLEVKLEASDQNLWAAQPTDQAPGESRAMLVFFNRQGVKTAELKLTQNAPTSTNLFVLLGTTAFRDLASTPDPDLLIPPLVSAGGGRVCFRNNPANVAATPIDECVAYGGFSGDNAPSWRAADGRAGRHRHHQPAP